MSWQKYTLVFRLLSPMHIGWRKVSNLQQTRGYLPGKNLWAALTARLTRDYDDGSDGKRYQEIGKQVQKHFRFTYLYPTLKNDNGDKTYYPWCDNFDYLFLDSYASTALNYRNKSAQDAMLHETEYIRPHTRPLNNKESQPFSCRLKVPFGTPHTRPLNNKESQPVYLKGHLYVQNEAIEKCDILKRWQEALADLQVGGERGYGWGRIQRQNRPLKGKPISGDPIGELVDGKITAHLIADNTSNIQGAVEPVLGWERKQNGNGSQKWQLSKAVIAFPPGTAVPDDSKFKIGKNSLLTQ